MRILVIEDDRTIAANVYDFLSASGHQVDAAADGVTGLHLAVSQPFDAIVLDIGLPGMDGLKLCAKLRADAQLDTPVLLLTARDTLQDKLRGFEAGADDYLVKPFELKEVEARLVALHRRSSGRVTMKVLTAGDLSLDLRTVTIRFKGSEVRLPPKCISLLELLMTEPGRLYRRSELEHAAWGDSQSNSDTLRSHMHTLRRTLLESGGYDPIETVHGIGYRLRPNAASA